MRVHIACDHAGYDLKNMLAEYLRTAGHDVVDHGAHDYDRNDDFPLVCFETGEAVVANPESLGVVIGGSGNGECIAVNKVIGVRAALAWNTSTAKLARRLHNANVIAIGARMQSIEDSMKIVAAFVNTEFSGKERHTRRIQQIADYEATRTSKVE
ncbi:MAG: ribose-5-phosphate isomerase [Candidatus Nanopelagicales bacterium]